MRSCKGGEPSCSHFGIARPYTEWVLLGAITFRFPGQKLDLDAAANMHVTNNEEANRYVKLDLPEGWELAL